MQTKHRQENKVANGSSEGANMLLWLELACEGLVLESPRCITARQLTAGWVMKKFLNQPC